MGWSAGSDWDWGWNATYSIQNGSLIMLSYYNDTGAPVLIQNCYLQLGTGDNSIDVGAFIGNSVTYYVTASGTGTDGVKQSSSELTINNSTSKDGVGIQTKTFTFAQPIYCTVGGTVNISMYFRMPTTWRCVVTARQRDNPNTFGGSIKILGAIRIYTSSGWKSAIPYVYNGGWKQAIPYIYKDQWQISS